MISDTEIHEMKRLSSYGLNTNQIANRLGKSYVTVKKYLDLDSEGIKQMREKERSRRQVSKCDIYRDEIIEMLTDFPELSSVQVFDRLEETHGSVEMAENTLANYVVRLRQELNLFKPTQERKRPRDYQAVPECKPGQQAQVDFGQINPRLESDPKRRKKLCFASMSLSYSRYKYVYFQDHPFNSLEVVLFHQKAFEKFKGVPDEIYYDQDATIVADENYGEIIFTKTFENYISQFPIEVKVCRARDPETKGKIENVVKYVKNNFARGRLFKDLETWNEECEQWLDRRANGKVHQTTKAIPRERFYVEQEALQEIPENINIPADILSLGVRKDNTVMYKGNRYDVPYGTYNRTKRVQLEVKDDNLTFVDINSGEILAEHKLCKNKGELITLERNQGKVSNTERQKRKEAFERLGATEEAKIFVEAITKNFPRYLKDQFGVIIQIATTWENEKIILQNALKECIHNETISAESLKSGG